MLNFLAQSPCRAPDWRWQRASGILNRQQPGSTPNRDTPAGHKWIKRALKFRRALFELDGDPVAESRLAMEMPDIFWAFKYTDVPESPIRSAIEARILAQETNQAIAYKAGCSVETVEAYEALFFNVRERLHHRDYITNVVMRDAIIRGLTDREYDLLWKMFGYAGGPLVLDALISKFTRPIRCQRVEEVSSFFQDTALNTMKQKAAVSAMTAPINSSSCHALIEAFVKYVEIERTTDSAAGGQEQILSNLSAMFSALPFGNGARERDRSSGMLPLDHSPVELKNNEMMISAAGFRLPHESMLLSARYPDEVSPDDAS